MPTAQVVTITEDTSGQKALQIVSWDCISTDAGVIVSQTVNAYNGVVAWAIVDPDTGDTIPTNLYDLTITDDDGLDILGGMGANLTNTTTYEWGQSDGLGYADNSKLTLNASHMGDTQGVRVTLHIQTTAVYTDLSKYKERLWPPGTPSDTVEDSILQGIITTASRIVDADTGRRFYTTRSDEARYFAPEWFDCLYTDDLISITTLKTDEDDDGTFETTWAATDYELQPYNAALENRPYIKIRTRRNGANSFPTGYKSVEVTGKFGYSTTIPPAIEEATILKAIALYNSRKVYGTSNIKNKDDVLSIAYQSIIAPFVRMI